MMSIPLQQRSQPRLVVSCVSSVGNTDSYRVDETDARTRCETAAVADNGYVSFSIIGAG